VRHVNIPCENHGQQHNEAADNYRPFARQTHLRPYFDVIVCLKITSPPPFGFMHFQ